MDNSKKNQNESNLPSRGFGNFLSDFFDTENMWNMPSMFPNLSRKNMPAVNIKETSKDFQVDLVAPGIPKENIHIDVDENVLTISGENKTEHENKDGERYTRREFSQTSFQRSFTLPESVDPEHIQAKFDNGVVNITIPKREENRKKPKREIKIS